MVIKTKTAIWTRTHLLSTLNVVLIIIPKHHFMKKASKYIFYSVFILLVFFSCKSGKNLPNEDIQEIVTLVLKEYDSVSLIKETYYSDKTFIPSSVLSPYYRAYSYKIMNASKSEKEKNVAYLVFLKDVDRVIKKEELDEMKERYKSWFIKEWKNTDINNNRVKLISLDSKKTYNDSINRLRLSEPLFTKDRKKAIIYESYSKNKTGAQGIRILVKENGNWVLKEGIPNGTSG